MGAFLPEITGGDEVKTKAHLPDPACISFLYFRDCTIVGSEKSKYDLERMCMKDGGIAAIEMHEGVYLWHSLFIGGMAYKKDCAKLFVVKKKSSVYFIQGVDGGLVKIGVSDNPYSRLDSHQCGSPVRLQIVKLIENVDRSLERHIHRKFSEFRRHGEWFDQCVLDMKCIA